MPFKLENSKAFVVFQDPNVGEFQFELFGETLMPDCVEEVRPL